MRAVGEGVIVQTGAGYGGRVLKLMLVRPEAFLGGAIPVEAVVYADLGQPLVQPGDRVRRGQPVAEVGPRGFVHFAVKSGEQFFDPALAGLRIA